MRKSPLRWSFAQQLSRQAMSIIIYLILASLLSPVEFGLMAIASVWVSASTLFLDGGFGTALIQKKNVTDEHFDSVFVVNIVLGCCIYLIIYMIAPYISSIYSEPVLKDVVRVVAVNVLFTAAASTKLSIAQKQLNFRMLTIRDVSAVAVGGGMGIVAAYSGLGVWSLVIQVVAMSAVLAVAAWNIVDWKPNIRAFSVGAVRELWGFSSKIFLFGLLKFVGQNADVLLIGLFMDSVAVGVYSFATKNVIVPVLSIRSAYGAYLFPRLSEIQHQNENIVAEYVLSIKRLGYLVAPVLVAIYFVSGKIIDFMFSGDWLAAIPVIKIITAVALLQCLITPLGELIKAVGRPGILVWWGIGFTCANVLAICVGTRWGVEGVSVALVLVHLLGVVVCAFISRMLIQIELNVIMKVYASPVVIFFALIMVATLLDAYADVSGMISVFVVMVLLFGLNVLLLKLFDPEFVDETCLVLDCKRWIRV